MGQIFEYYLLLSQEIMMEKAELKLTLGTSRIP